MPYDFQFPSQEELLAMGLAAVPDDMDKTENAFVHQVVKATSIMAHEVLIRGEFGFSMLFLDGLSGAYLDRFVFDRTGILRRPAVAAHGKIRITGKPGTYVPQGTAVTNGEVRFLLAYGDSIGEGGTVDIEAVAETPGDQGYFPAGSLNKLAKPILGVSDVTNVEQIANGFDIENDTSLRARYRSYFLDFPTTNNPAQFRHWANEVKGVGQARIIRAFKGPGTVKVLVLDQHYRPAESGILSAVRTHIEERMGFDVRELAVEAPAAVALNVRVTLRLSDGFKDDEVKTGIAERLRTWLEAYPDPNYIRAEISFWDIASMIKSTPGVLDIVSMTLNGGQANVKLTEEQVPIVGVIE